MPVDLRLKLLRLFMRKFYLSCSKSILIGLLVLLAFSSVNGQQVTITGTGTTSSYLYGPIYSFAGAPRNLRIAMIYPQSLLSSMPAGSIITKLQLSRNTATGDLPAGNSLKLYLANTSLTTYGTADLPWDISGATEVFNGDPSAIVGTTAGWKEFPLSTTFNYTGGAIILFSEYSQVNDPAATIAWDYNSSTGQPAYAANSVKYTVSSTTSMPASMTSETANHANLKIDYVLNTPCSGTPTPGVLAKNPTTGVCPGTSVALSLSGQSMGTGLTFELLSASAVAGPYAPVGSPQSTSTFSVAPATNTWYRVRVACGANADTTTAIEVSTVPTAGSILKSPSTSVCTGSPVSLSLTGNSSGTGITYQLLSASSSGGPYSTVGSAQATSSFSVSPTTSTWYRIITSCGSGNEDTAAAVQVVVNPAMAGGNYTINSAVATGGSNFQTFTDAVAALTCGITGAVTFTVAPGSGPYTEQISIPQINGADASNRITFKGNLATIYSPGATSAARATIKLDGADYITIDSLIIDSSRTTYNWGIHLTNTADYNIISNNEIRLNPTITTSNNHMGIVASNSNTTSASSGNNANYNTITGNTITGGYNSIVLYGSSTAGAQNLGNVISNNIIADAYSHTMEIFYQSGAVISNNDISKATRLNSTTTSGVYLATGTLNTLVEKNKIHNFFDANSSGSTFYGLYASGADAKPGLENKFYNNLVYNIYGNTTQYGIYNVGSDSAWYYHNTIVLDNPVSTAGTTYGIYQTTAAKGIEFRNNNVVIGRAGTGTKRAIIFGTIASIIASNNNNLFINSTGGTNNFLGEYDALPYETLDDWQIANAGAFDQQSVSVDPLFTNPGGGDFSPTNALMNNIGANLGVTTDITGATRSASPDPGAYEFSIAPCSNPVAGIVSPSSLRVCTGNSVTLDLINNSFGEGQTYQWQFSTDSLNWTNIGSALASPLFSTVQTTTRYYRAVVTCGPTSVNSPGVLVTTPGLLSGTFTINNGMQSSATNFQTFEEAIDYIKCGINGPVVFDVAPSLYNEQFTIPVIPGASAVNTIKILGHGATVAFAPTVSGRRSVILLEGADYVTIDSLNIDATGGTYGWAIQFTDSADYNTISNSTIIADVTATSTNYAGIVISASPTSATTTGNSANFTTIKGNTINGGYYGIVATGLATTYTKNNTIDSNTVTNQYFAGIHATNQENLVISRNNIHRPDRTNTSTAYYGIYTLTGSKNALVEANRIHNSHDNQSIQTGATSAIYIDAAATAGFETKVINNLVYNLNNAAGPIYGLRFGNGFIKAYHNTISFDNQASKDTTTYGVYAENFGGIELKNNVISITRTGTPAFNPATVYKYGIYSAVVSTNVLVETNNDVYVTGPNSAFGYTGGSARLTLAAWQATGLGSGSNDKDPGFIDPTSGDYTPTNPYLDNAGVGVGVTTDILGVGRPVTSPDIGAYEFSVPVDVIPPTITYTNIPYSCSTADRTLTGVQISDVGGMHTSGALAPKIYFKKAGTSTWYSNTGTLTSGTAESGFWSFTISSSTIPGIATGDTVQYFIIAQDSTGNVTSRPGAGLSATNVNTITSYPTTPAYYTISVLNGVYTVGAGGNFPTLASAVSAYNNSCLAGPVTFSLTDASYTQTASLILNAHPDASATKVLTIKPAAGVNVTISGAVASGPIFRILGNYVTIDGSNNGTSTRNLTISNTSTTTPSVIHIASTGTTVQSNVTLKNATIINGSTSNSAISVRDVAGGYGYMKDVVIDNNSIQKAYFGVYVVVESGAGNGRGLRITNNDLSTAGANAIRYAGIYLYNPDSAVISGNIIGNFEKANGENDKGIWAERISNTEISNNTISGLGYTGTGAFAAYGIHNSLTSDSNRIFGNIISGITASGTVAPAGIYVNGANTYTKVSENKISNISNTNTTGYGAYGIWLASSANPANDTLVNNFVSNITAYGSLTPLNNGVGINVTAGSGYMIYNNTVRLHTNQTTAGVSSALHISSGVSAAGAINLRNNILVNSQTTGVERYAIYSGSSNTIFAAIDYNDYWSAGANLGYIISNRSNLAAIQAGFGGNANSINILPVFAGLNDLHIDPPYNLALNDKGTPIASVATDIDAEVRNASTPDVGADEFTSSTGVDVGVLFQILPATKSCYTVDTVSVRIRNLSGVAIDFTVNPVTVNASVTGPNATTFTPVVINTGSLAPGDSMTVVITNSYDMSAAGTYVFNANTVAAGDVNPANDAMPARTIVVTAVNAGTVTSSRTSYCLTGGTPTLTNTGASNYGSLQWEQATGIGGPWTPVGTGGTTYTPSSAITSTMYYRLSATCGTNTATSNVVTVVLEQPQVLTATGATRCGPGTVNLQATGSAGSSILWYTAPTGGSPVHTGTSFTTPVLSDTTTYYVSASTGGPTLTVGAPDLSIGTSASVGSYYVNFHVLAPVTIQSVDVFWNATVGSTYSIIIRDSTTQATVFTHSGTTTATGTTTPQTVMLNSSLSPGVYQMGFATNPGAYRNSTGGSYPYTAPGYLSITGNTFNNNAYYYYYYNWKIGTGCESARTAVVATVNHPVAITSQPASQTICVGNPVTFSVATTGTTPMAYEWKKNGITIAGATSSSYTISSVSFSDVANYSVVVTNTCNAVASADATLTVNANTVITTEPSAQVVCAGSNANFTVVSNGAGLTYQWRKAGVNISGANAATFTITGATAADAASYDVVVSGACGNDTSVSVSLTVNAVTAITTQPSAQVICEGAALNLSVAANGTSLTYQWRKNTVNIAGATSATYSIAAATAADGGSYDVIVTGTCGTETSAAVTVTVNAPVVVTAQPVAQTICAGAAASFSVTATGSGLTYQWRKNTVNIAGATSASYSIAAANAADAGNYDVVISGSCNNVTSTSVALTVNTPVAITTQPGAQAVCLGANATFTVVTTGTVTGYQWRKNTVNITGATSATYTITGVTAGDAASYDVVITGPCGNATSTAAALSLNAATVINTQPVAQTLCALNAINLSVSAAGSGTLTYQWRKGGTPITGATSATFNIASASVADGGNYDVVVTGACGSVTSNSVAVTVNACTALPSVDADVTSALLMPNVVRQNTVLRVVVRRSTKIDWTITDASGRKVMTFTKQMTAGQSDITLSLDKLASGTYYLNATTSRGRIETIRFVKL
jgi:hypothetical protein